MIIAGCGIPRDREPTITPGGVVMPADAPSDAPVVPAGPSVPEADVAVFFVQAEHLVKVGRRVRRADLTGALDVLLAGPKEAELAAGIRTAISPQTDLRTTRLDGDTAVVDLSAAFVEVGGAEQILAVAQVVLTTTALPGVGRVRFLLEGQDVEIPRADGTLSSESLGAADYEGLLTGAP
jgi:Sporulation and spore germination